MSLLGADSLPPGDLRSIVLHWTGSDYTFTFPAYHFCVALARDGLPRLVATHALTANMRDVRTGTMPYAAHTAGRNSYAIGIAICGMSGATPHDFGRFPLRDDGVAVACAAAASLAAFYRIPVAPEYVFTHAEAAVTDGYFGAGEDQRWDIARLQPENRRLVRDEARVTGDALREHIRLHDSSAT